MKTFIRTLAGAGIAAAALAPSVHAQDQVAVAPAHTRVLVENARVRVIESTLPPGAKDPLHTHPAGWYYVTRPGAMKVAYADGHTETWAPKAGESGWLPGEGAHTSENIGRGPITFVLVEVKGAPSTVAARK
jgi:oxalate decarboxylase/phosphoglucose isomerase-like protein (cupin superfamily)